MTTGTSTEKRSASRTDNPRSLKAWVFPGGNTVRIYNPAPDQPDLIVKRLKDGSLETYEVKPGNKPAAAA